MVARAPPTDSRLRLTVKALGNSSTDLQQITPGTWIVAEGPYGAMTADRRTREDVVLIAGGVGITPMRSLFETIPSTGGQRLTLIYRAGNATQVLFRDELDTIARALRSTVWYLLGDDRDCLSARPLSRLAPRLADPTSTSADHRRWRTPSDPRCARQGSRCSTSTGNGSHGSDPGAAGRAGLGSSCRRPRRSAVSERRCCGSPVWSGRRSRTGPRGLR